jgi:DNA-binding NarL/FixJ family response regulator
MRVQADGEIEVPGGPAASEGIPALAPVPVRVIAPDPISRLGALAALRSCPALAVAGPAELARVVIIIVDSVVKPALDLLRAQLDQPGRPAAVMVAADFGPGDALLAITEGALGLVRRSGADAAGLARAVLAAAVGDCVVPPDTLASLLAGRAVPTGSATAGFDDPRPARDLGLTEREHAVLSLIAEGRETDEIARELCYSPRTITGIVHGVTRRWRLRNRSHAVAYALRAGLL